MFDYCYFAVQNNVCAEFDTKFSHKFAGGGKFLCAHLNFELKTCTNEQVFVRSQLVCELIMVINYDMHLIEVSHGNQKPPVHIH